jgi:hypothetical protein
MTQPFPGGIQRSVFTEVFVGSRLTDFFYGLRDAVSLSSSSSFLPFP